MSYKLVGIGTAGHVQIILGALPQHPQVRLVACAPSFPGEDLGAYLAQPVAGQPPRVYADWRAMLAEESPEIVLVCGQYGLNGAIAIEAARRGCHILSEKPAGQTLAEVAELRRLLAEQGLHYGMLLPMRYEAPFYTARQVVAKGIIGEPCLITAQKSYRWGPSRPAWYADRSRYGSTMTWVGIHAFDYARWVAGVEYTEVYAQHANLAHPAYPGCQDVATVIARLRNGGSALFNLDYLRPAAAPTHGDDRLRIAGSQGVLEICDRGTRLHILTAQEDVPTWPLVAPERTLLGDFLAALEGRGAPLIPAEEALSISAFAILAAQAADTGQVLRVSEP
jgi:predicted dehydrogenase